MSIDIPKFALVGGEVSESYYGRADLAKHDVSLAIAENWFVDYHGGISTAPGTEMLDFIKNDQYPVKLFTFKFSSTVENTNIIMMGKDYIRFAQDGAYVLEASKVIDTISLANPGVIGVTNHGWTTGDWVKLPNTGAMTQLQGRTVQITVLTANTFSIQDTFGANINTTAYTAYVAGGEAARIYTIVSPYQPEHIEEIQYSQIRDLIRFTHPLYKTKDLTRLDSASWTLANTVFDSSLERPDNFTLTAIQGGGGSVGFQITQVNLLGEESLPSDHQFVIGTTNNYIDATTGGIIMTWNPINGAAYYNVYRTRLLRDGFSMSRAYQTGYIGQSKGANFTDHNYAADFTRTPPKGNNPFADGAITNINILNAGNNYTSASLITAADPNAAAGGFIGYVVHSPTFASQNGPIAGIIILDGGHDYTNPVFTVTVGAGCILEAEIGPRTGNNPSVSAVYQQRQVYGATLNAPLTIDGSRPGKLSNFTTSDILLANDSYEHEIDSDNFSPIRHLIPARGGLLAMSVAKIWLLAGTSGAAISAVDVQAEPQSGSGVSTVPPIKVNSDIIYCEGEGGKVMILSYNDIIKLYAGVDLSLLASHLITPTKQIKAWTYAHEPFKMVWAVRTDGVMLNFTIIKEQEVFAFTRRLTQGIFLDVASIINGAESDVYLITRRYINGRHTKFFERVARRDFTHVEDAFCVDCGLSLSVNNPDATLQLSATTGAGIDAISNNPVFAAGDVGRVLRFGRAKATVATYVNTRNVKVNFIRDVTDTVPFTNPVLPRRAESGEWSLDTAVTTVSGLHHLEGSAVSVLADGNVVTGKTVTNGAITIPQASSRVVVGLPYTCTMKNLPLNLPGSVIENKKQRVTALNIRVKDARGLKVGNDLRDLYPMKERTSEAWGQPTELQSGMRQQLVEPIWTENATSYIVQEEPLPATVLGYILDIEVGDDPN